MTAARTGNIESVKLLLAHGADVHATEEYRGQNALMWAATENHSGVMRLLIERGADVNARSAKMKFGSVKMAAGGAFFDRAEGGLTPLFFAAREGHLDAGRISFSAGADFNAE